MTDPLRSDATVPAQVPERDREARVEELLLTASITTSPDSTTWRSTSGPASSSWTAAMRAPRAYIERARSAIAERQREGEELAPHRRGGVSSRRAGSGARLLTSAVERGAGTEEALALLGPARSSRSRERAAGEPRRTPRGAPRRGRPAPKRRGGSIDRGLDGLPPARSLASRLVAVTRRRVVGAGRDWLPLAGERPRARPSAPAMSRCRCRRRPMSGSRAPRLVRQAGTLHDALRRARRDRARRSPSRGGRQAARHDPGQLLAPLAPAPPAGATAAAPRDVPRP